ncbi:squalene/phytoene synthase family protein [Glycocaulis abyssi]|uniref:Squalene/phytoene synthase family protein n=1 Tax=Glycocaulis abyssi TaxID=1433403 RepID=A0ABV9N926_9PROT
MSADSLTDTVRRDDPDRYLAALFAPEPVRARLWALYVFNAEIARIPSSVTEPVIGEMRLAWARDAVSDLFAEPPRVRRHPVYEALAALRGQRGGPALDDLVALIEARNADLGEGAFPDAAERERYVDRSSGLVMQLAAAICAPDWQPGEEGQAALIAAARLWGYSAMLRDFARLCAAGRPPVAEAELTASGASLEALRRGLEPEKALLARTGLVDAARGAAAALDTSRKSLPAEIFPAIGYVMLARPVLKAAKRQSDPYAPLPDSALIMRQLRLLGASLSGRV